jgi:hypothetical protein
MATRDGFYLNDLVTLFFGQLDHLMLSGAFLRPVGQIATTFFVRRADVLQKIQFASTESLLIAIPPFINKFTGDLFLGTDAVTLTIKKPNGALLSGPPTPTFDTDVRMWVATVTTGSFMAGKWMVRASSSGANADDQNVVFTWGDYVDMPAAINTKIGAPAGASVSADIANINFGVSTINTKIGTPAGASVSADIANINFGVSTIATAIGALPTANEIRDAVLNATRSGFIATGSVGEGIALATSLLQGNYYIDNIDNSNSNGPVAQRLRCFISAAAMASVSYGGTGEGEFATFLVTTTYDGVNKIHDHKVVQQ